jgi:four helix bundle protein
MEQDVRSYRDLIVWHRSIELCIAIYEFTRAFPKEEMFGLRSQLQRAAVSIPSNIAEGSGRRSSGEFVQFLGTGRGSNNEVQTQLSIADRLGFGNAEVRFTCERLSNEVERMLNSLITSVKTRKNRPAAAQNQQ